MCGIAGIHVFNPENAPKYSKMENAIDNLFSAIDHRGGDATGFVAISDEGNVVWQKASCNAFEFYKERRNIPWGTRSVLLHTRMATQGSAAFPENNHPVRRGSVYIVHNGHIWNDNEVFRKTKRERYGQVDSEAIAAVIAKFGIMETHKAMEEVAGAAAIGVIDETRPGIMVLARGASSPLMFYRNENIAVFASTKEAVKRAWKTLYGTAPKDNKIMDVDEGTAIYLDNSEVETKRFVPDDYYYSYSRPVSNYTGGLYYSGGRYSHYLDNKKSLADKWDWSDEKEDLSHDDLKVTFVGEGEILCSHGCDYLDCEICNPDDEFGSYLPVKADEFKETPKISSGGNGWVDAAKCELCDLWFAEYELTKVKDWEDDWMFCKTCMEEMSEVLTDVASLDKPIRIHGQSIDEDAAITWLTTDEVEYI